MKIKEIKAVIINKDNNTGALKFNIFDNTNIGEATANPNNNDFPMSVNCSFIGYSIILLVRKIMNINKIKDAPIIPIIITVIPKK